MKEVAKLVIIDDKGQYFLMSRNNHPHFGNDPDIPGGELDDSETPLQAIIREVQEEIALTIDDSKLKQIYSGTDYSKYGTNFSLYIIRLIERPNVCLSWEHSSYEWVNKNDFLYKAKNAKDTFMHMVYELVKQT